MHWHFRFKTQCHIYKGSRNGLGGRIYMGSSKKKGSWEIFNKGQLGHFSLITRSRHPSSRSVLLNNCNEIKMPIVIYLKIAMLAHVPFLIAHFQTHGISASFHLLKRTPLSQTGNQIQFLPSDPQITTGTAYCNLIFQTCLSRETLSACSCQKYSFVRDWQYVTVECRRANLKRL